MSKSLADTLEELIAAIRENTAALQGAKGSVTVKVTKPAAPKPAPAVEAPAAAVVAVPTYDSDVRPVALKLAQAKGREALVALLAKFGAKAGPELPADKYSEFVAEATAAME